MELPGVIQPRNRTTPQTWAARRGAVIVPCSHRSELHGPDLTLKGQQLVKRLPARLRPRLQDPSIDIHLESWRRELTTYYGRRELDPRQMGVDRDVTELIPTGPPFQNQSNLPPLGVRFKPLRRSAPPSVLVHQQIEDDYMRYRGSWSPNGKVQGFAMTRRNIRPHQELNMSVREHARIHAGGSLHSQSTSQIPHQDHGMYPVGDQDMTEEDAGFNSRELLQGLFSGPNLNPTLPPPPQRENTRRPTVIETVPGYLSAAGDDRDTPPPGMFGDDATGAPSPSLLANRFGPDGQGGTDWQDGSATWQPSGEVGQQPWKGFSDEFVQSLGSLKQNSEDVTDRDEKNSKKQEVKAKVPDTQQSNAENATGKGKNVNDAGKTSKQSDKSSNDDSGKGNPAQNPKFGQNDPNVVGATNTTTDIAEEDDDDDFEDRMAREFGRTMSSDEMQEAYRSMDVAVYPPELLATDPKKKREIQVNIRVHSNIPDPPREEEQEGEKEGGDEEAG